jgi:hypothetical protein
MRTAAHRYVPLLLVLGLLPHVAFALDIDLFVNLFLGGSLVIIVLTGVGVAVILHKIFSSKK